MSKIYVVYWSQTGNTEAMANAVAEGIQASALPKLRHASRAISSGVS